jgi:hypothetical protein
MFGIGALPSEFPPGTNGTTLEGGAWVVADDAKEVVE